MKMHARALVFCVALGLSAAAPITDTEFSGTAHIGTLGRDVIIRFTCALDRGKLTYLAVGLDVPEAEAFQPVFDVIPFEGPTGIRGKHHLVATAGNHYAQVDFGSTGSFGNNGVPATTFTFFGYMSPEPGSRASLQRLQAVAAILASGPGHLAWTVENPAHGGSPIEATKDLTATDSARLKSAIAPCLPQ